MNHYCVQGIPENKGPSIIVRSTICMITRTSPTYLLSTFMWELLCKCVWFLRLEVKGDMSSSMGNDTYSDFFLCFALTCSNLCNRKRLYMHCLVQANYYLLPLLTSSTIHYLNHFLSTNLIFQFLTPWICMITLRWITMTTGNRENVNCFVDSW